MTKEFINKYNEKVKEAYAVIQNAKLKLQSELLGKEISLNYGDDPVNGIIQNVYFHNNSLEIIVTDDVDWNVEKYDSEGRPILKVFFDELDDMNIQFR